MTKPRYRYGHCDRARVPALHRSYLHYIRAGVLAANGHRVCYTDDGTLVILWASGGATRCTDFFTLHVRPIP